MGTLQRVAKIIILMTLNILHAKADVISDSLLLLSIYSVSKSYSFIENPSIEAIRVSHKYKPTELKNSLPPLINRNSYAQSITMFHSPQKTSHKYTHLINSISLERVYSTKKIEKINSDIYSMKLHHSMIAYSGINNFFVFLTLGSGLSVRYNVYKNDFGISSEMNAGFIYKLSKKIYLQLGDSLFVTKWSNGEYYIGGDLHVSIIYGNM